MAEVKKKVRRVEVVEGYTLELNEAEVIGLASLLYRGVVSRDVTTLGLTSLTEKLAENAGLKRTSLYDRTPDEIGFQFEQSAKIKGRQS